MVLCCVDIPDLSTYQVVDIWILSTCFGCVSSAATNTHVQVFVRTLAINFFWLYT